MMLVRSQGQILLFAFCYYYLLIGKKSYGWKVLESTGHPSIYIMMIIRFQLSINQVSNANHLIVKVIA